MRTVTIEVTEDHISKYGRDSGHPTGCPIFHAAREVGLNVGAVWYEEMVLYSQGWPEGDQDTFPMPPEAEQWQRDAVEIPEALRSDRLEPITFTIEVPDDF